MITYKCPNCGGEQEIGSAGSLECPYCGSRSFFSDADFRGSKAFRKKLLSYYKAKEQEKENDYSKDTLWESNGKVSFETDKGQHLSIEYMVKYDYSNCTCFIAKETVVYVFNHATDATDFLRGLACIDYPSADVKLSRCFPSLKMNIALKSGTALVFVRKPNFYPVEVFAPLQSVHLAWVISRMENICCAFEYSEISHMGIDATSVFINPKTHEGMLFGDWSLVRRKNGDHDLKSIRKTAISVAANKNDPLELGEFLNSHPKCSAYDDFEYWDTVIEKGFGGHKFVKM